MAHTKQTKRKYKTKEEEDAARRQMEQEKTERAEVRKRKGPDAEEDLEQVERH